jgi:hypothetical protein
LIPSVPQPLSGNLRHPLSFLQKEEGYFSSDTDHRRPAKAEENPLCMISRQLRRGKGRAAFSSGSSGSIFSVRCMEEGDFATSNTTPFAIDTSSGSMNSGVFGAVSALPKSQSQR